MIHFLALHIVIGFFLLIFIPRSIVIDFVYMCCTEPIERTQETSLVHWIYCSCDLNV